MTTTDSGAAHGSPRNTESINITMDLETRQRLERLRDLLPMNPSRSQVVRYAVTELYYREIMHDYGELPGSPFTKQKPPAA